MIDRRKFIFGSAAALVTLALPWKGATSRPNGLIPLDTYGVVGDPPIPVLYGDGIHDDTVALQAWFDEKPVVWPNGERVDPKRLWYQLFRTTGTIDARAWSRGDGSFCYNRLWFDQGIR